MSAGRSTWFRERLLAAVLLVIVFAAGALSSAALLRVARADSAVPTPSVRDGNPAFRGGPPARGGGRGGGWLAPELAAQLELTEEQRSALGTILEAHSARSRQILESMEPLLAAQLDSARSAIRDVLSDEQRALFDTYIEEHRGFMERRFGGRGGPGRRGGRR